MDTSLQIKVATLLAYIVTAAVLVVLGGANV